MHFLTRWFIHNPVAANLMMALILFLGMMTLHSMRIEGFPRIPADSVIVTTLYPDAPAVQVDELVTRKIEKALQGLDGVRSVSAQSENSLSTVTVRRAGGQDLNRLLDKIRMRVEGIGDLPAAARRPTIDTSGFDFPALYINLTGDTDPDTLQTLAKRLREELLAEPELSRLEVWGLHDREMRIEVVPVVLQRLNLTVADVVEKIRLSSLDFKAGSLRTHGGDVILRADNKARFVTEFSTIPVIEHTDGSVVRLGQIARISDTFVEGDYLFRFDGKATAGMEVLVGQKENLLHISEAVHRVVDQFKPLLPSSVEVVVWGDASNYIADRLQLLRSNGIQGLLLVTLMLALFLNVRLAFWVAMGIPISVMGAIAVAGSRWVDYSLNDVTTFGLIIALGILVDDAVVVGESVFEERRKHSSHNTHPLLTTETGVNKVAVATVFGVLTTIAAFFPMLLIDNPLGKVLAGFSGVVILALIFSLIESKFILPAHLAYLNMNTQPRFLLSSWWAKIQAVAQTGLRHFRVHVYAPVLVRAIYHRYAVLILFIAAASLGLGQIALGKIKTVFFPDVPGQIITVNLEMDARAPFRLIRQHMQQIESIGETLNREIGESKGLSQAPIRSMFTIISSAQSAQLYAELTPVSERPGTPVLDIVRQWRERTGQLEGSTDLEFTGSEELAGGFQLKLLSRDIDLLEQASAEVRQFVDQLEGISNVRDTLSGGRPQLEIRVKPEARHLGFTPDTLASQVGYAFGGAEVHKVQRDENEVRVMVLNNNHSRDSIDDLLQSRIRSEQGAWIPFSTIADISGGYVSGILHRENGKHLNTLSAGVDRDRVAPEEVAQAVFGLLVPQLAIKYPSVEIRKAGELEEMGEIKGGVVRALIIAAVLIYVLMAVPLKSYWQPVVILTVVPFGFIGAAVGHLIMDVPLSLLSLFGMMALTGVVVNDCLVMITRYNLGRDSGLDIAESLKDAGVGRFQAIFLTTATTVAGLLPLLSETSEQAQYLIPAAISLAYGEIFATALTLILVPVLLAIAEDAKRLLLPGRPVHGLDAGKAGAAIGLEDSRR